MTVSTSCYAHCPTYVMVEDVAAVILQLGPGSVLAKLDVASAYRIIPVNPDDCHLLGMKWEGKLFVDTARPFDLRSSQKMFNAIADELEWVIRARGMENTI